MKRLLRKITGQIGETLPWKFEQADFTEVTEPFGNPARGWYQIYNFSVENLPDREELEWGLDQKDRLALLVIDIGHYRDRDLDSTCMKKIKELLTIFQNAGYDMILRMVYDHEGKGLEREPFTFSQVERHLEQIGELFERFPNAIFVYQGMLVGNWGEMHTTRHLKDDRMKRLANVLRQKKSSEMYLAVRRPVQWRCLHTENTDGFNASKNALAAKDTMKPQDAMGLFDDGMFGSESHLGTFGVAEKTVHNWEEAWNRKEELAFEKELCRWVPNGGEAVYTEEYTANLKPDKVERILRKMQVTYLNRMHDKRVLDQWKDWKYEGAGVWHQKSFYDYVGAHLGYRFLVKAVKVSVEAGKSDTCLVETEIENVGFARFYQENEVFLEYKDRQGNAVLQKLELDLRELDCGQAKRIVCKIAPFDGKLYLVAKRKWDEANIRFANFTEQGGKVVLGTFKLQEVKK